MLPTELREQSKELREQEILNQVFPFRIPPESVINGTYFVEDEAFCVNRNIKMCMIGK